MELGARQISELLAIMGDSVFVLSGLYSIVRQVFERCPGKEKLCVVEDRFWNPCGLSHVLCFLFVVDNSGCLGLYGMLFRCFMISVV